MRNSHRRHQTPIVAKGVAVHDIPCPVGREMILIVCDTDTRLEPRRRRRVDANRSACDVAQIVAVECQDSVAPLAGPANGEVCALIAG